jgi:hypothetical protein
MPQIKIDRNLFGRLVDRWNKLEIEQRGFREMLERVKQQNPARAADLEALYQVLTDSLRNEWREFDSGLKDAWATEDDDAFLGVLDRFLSHLENGR